MNASKLAKKMLKLEQLWAQVNDLENEIKETVLEMESTQTTGTVRASYSGGRKRYDYYNAGQEASAEIITAFTTPVPASIKVDWKKVCAEAEIEASFTQSAPTVTLKTVAMK